MKQEILDGNNYTDQGLGDVRVETANSPAVLNSFFDFETARLSNEWNQVNTILHKESQCKPWGEIAEIIRTAPKTALSKKELEVEKLELAIWAQSEKVHECISVALFGVIDEDTIGILSYISVENISVFLARKLVELADRIHEVEFDGHISANPTVLQPLAIKKQFLLDKVYEACAVFVSQGSFQYFEERLQKNLLQRIRTERTEFMRKLFQSERRKRVAIELSDVSQSGKGVYYGKGIDKIKEFIESAAKSSLLTDIVNPLQSEFNAFKSDVRNESRRTRAMSVLKSKEVVIVQADTERIQKLEEEQKILVRIGKIRARLDNLMENLRPLEREEQLSILAQMEQTPLVSNAVREQFEAIMTLIENLSSEDEAVDKNEAVLGTKNQPSFTPARNQDTDGYQESGLNSKEYPISPEQLKEALALVSEIGALRLHVKNPSSTNITNKKSYGDGNFWFNILSPLLNIIKSKLISNPEIITQFSWREVANWEETIALYSKLQFKHWHSLLQNCTPIKPDVLLESSDDQIDTQWKNEWSRLPELIEQQIGSGGWSQTVGGKKPLGILLPLIRDFFVKR